MAVIEFGIEIGVYSRRDFHWKTVNVQSGLACTRELGPYSKLTSKRLFYLEYIPINRYICTVAVFLEYVVGLSLLHVFNSWFFHVQDHARGEGKL